MRLRLRPPSYVQTAADCIDYVSQVLDLLDHAGSSAPHAGPLPAAAAAAASEEEDRPASGSRSISSINDKNKSWPQLFGAITATLNDEHPRWGGGDVRARVVWRVIFVCARVDTKDMHTICVYVYIHLRLLPRLVIKSKVKRFGHHHLSRFCAVAIDDKAKEAWTEVAMPVSPVGSAFSSSHTPPPF